MDGLQFPKRLPYKNETYQKSWNDNIPKHGSQEMGKGLENKIMKDARVELNVKWCIRPQIFGQVGAKNNSIAVATELFFNEEMA